MMKKKIKSQNIVWQQSKVTADDRKKILGHEGAVVWFTGFSGSGKSTLAMALEKALIEQGVYAYILDGDNVRQGLNSDLGFHPEDRTENIRRVGEVAKLFCDAGMVVITAFISPYAADRDQVREVVGEKFLEVFVSCPIEECEKRDPKGLYKKARSGEICDFTGISAPYEVPENPEIILHTDREKVRFCIEKVIASLKEKKILSI